RAMTRAKATTTTTKVTTTTTKATTGEAATRRSLVGAALLLVLCAALSLAASVGASNASLRLILDRWSRKIGADARSLSLAAQHRHPRRMTTRALRFTADARRARKAIATQRASTARGARARRLALRA